MKYQLKKNYLKMNIKASFCDKVKFNRTNDIYCDDDRKDYVFTKPLNGQEYDYFTSNPLINKIKYVYI